MAIPRPLQGYKQLAGLQAPGVVTRSQKADLGILGSHRTAAPAGGLLQRDSAHSASNLISSVMDGQPRGDLLPLIQMAFDAMDLLIGFVSLPRQDNHISRLSMV